MPIPDKEYEKVEFETSNACRAEFEALEGELAYEILDDACIVQLAERFKLMEATSNDL
jgi:hypothetical protein